VPPEKATVADSFGRFWSGRAYDAGHAFGLADALADGDADGDGDVLAAMVAVGVSEAADAVGLGSSATGADAVAQPAASAMTTSQAVRMGRR
jgi:hypothetical protein